MPSRPSPWNPWSRFSDWSPLSPLSLPPLALVTGQKLSAWCSPLRFLVHGVGGDAAQAANHLSVHTARHGGNPRPRRLIHERHELVGEARHGAADADPAHVRATPHPVEPAALGHVAFDDGAPATKLDDALRRPVLGGEVALLVVTGAVTALVDGGPEQPLGAQGLVQGDHGGLPGRL